jgi:hypothetical protein
MSTLNMDVFYLVQEVQQAIDTLQRMKEVIEMNANRSTNEISAVLNATFPYGLESVLDTSKTLKDLLRNPNKISEMYMNYAIDQRRLRNISDYASSLGLVSPMASMTRARTTMRGGKPKSRKTSRRK